MNRFDYIKELKQNLKFKLKKEEITKVTTYYQELIEDRIESGQSEKDVVRDLGRVDLLAHKIVGEFLEREEMKEVAPEKTKREFSKAKVVFFIIASPVLVPLIFALCIIVFSLSIALVSTFFSLGIGFVCAGIGCIAGFIASSITLFIGTGIMIAGGAVFAEVIFFMGYALFAIGITGILAYLFLKYAKALVKAMYKIFKYTMQAVSNWLFKARRNA